MRTKFLHNLRNAYNYPINPNSYVPQGHDAIVEAFEYKALWMKKRVDPSVNPSLYSKIKSYKIIYR